MRAYLALLVEIGTDQQLVALVAVRSTACGLIR